MFLPAALKNLFVLNKTCIPPSKKGGHRKAMTWDVFIMNVSASLTAGDVNISPSREREVVHQHQRVLNFPATLCVFKNVITHINSPFCREPLNSYVFCNLI